MKYEKNMEFILRCVSDGTLDVPEAMGLIAELFDETYNKTDKDDSGTDNNRGYDPTYPPGPGFPWRTTPASIPIGTPYTPGVTEIGDFPTHQPLITYSCPSMPKGYTSMTC